jgi:hypothetical protein
MSRKVLPDFVSDVIKRFALASVKLTPLLGFFTKWPFRKETG